MNYLFIAIAIIIVIAIYLLYSGLKGALHITEEEDPFITQEETPKFEPRKVTDFSKGTFGTDPVAVAPKKKYYKKRKKKAPVEKKPVGRPRKNTE